MPTRKGPVQIRFEILEYMYFNPSPQPRTHIWRKATTMSYDDFLKHLSYARAALGYNVYLSYRHHLFYSRWERRLGLLLHLEEEILEGRGRSSP